MFWLGMWGNNFSHNFTIQTLTKNCYTNDIMKNALKPIYFCVTIAPGRVSSCRSFSISDNLSYCLYKYTCTCQACGPDVWLRKYGHCNYSSSQGRGNESPTHNPFIIEDSITFIMKRENKVSPASSKGSSYEISPAVLCRLANRTYIPSLSLICRRPTQEKSPAFETFWVVTVSKRIGILAIPKISEDELDLFRYMVITDGVGPLSNMANAKSDSCVEKSVTIKTKTGM
ncbi:hypothetical protein STEG23_025120 [Scotinomys teguina]